MFREAAAQFGVELTPQEDYDWLVILGAGMLVDHLVDVEKADIAEPFEEIVSGHIREDLSADIQIRAINYMLRQTEEGRRRIFDRVRQVNELAAAQREAVLASEVVGIRITEADILSSLLSLPTEGVSDSAARSNFNFWLASWSRVGYLLDSLFDAKQDYRNGESGMRPTIRSRLRFALAASKESVTALKRTPPRLLGKCALNGINYVVRQKRVKLLEDSSCLKKTGSDLAGATSARLGKM